MITHCAGELGLLSYLYQQRHKIETVLGWIDEKPIAVCSNGFTPDANLVVQTDDSDQSIPPELLNTHEIQLFFHFKSADLICQEALLLGDVCNTAYQLFIPPNPPVEILQPPRV
jgi:hypothetical protein